MVTATFDSTARFEKALVRIIHGFNRLDANVGLCVAHLMNPSEPTRAYSELSIMTAEKRFERLKRLLDANNVRAEDLKELSQWYERSATVRRIRNRYVHGIWEFLPLRHEEPVGVSAQPWMKDKLGPMANETMSLEKIESVADEVEAVCNEFIRLRRKLGV